MQEVEGEMQEESKMAHEVLYHYCSMEALLGILQNKSLRLTNARYMNDSKEISWIYEIAKKVLWDKQFQCNSENELRLCKRLLSHCDELFLSETSFPSYYCSCFSTNGDSLSQWRAYADDGRGVAIGFSRSFLESCMVPHLIKLQSVEYVDSQNLSYVTNEIDQAFSKVREVKRELTNDEINAIWYETSTIWDRKAIFVKNAAFLEESEVRIFHLPHSQLQYDQIGKIDFFHRNGVLVPYMPLKLPFDKEPIVRIAFGPKNRMEHNRNSILHLTETLGLRFSLAHFEYSAASYGDVRRTEKLYPPPR